MAEQINRPMGFGGLMRFSEEYKSKLNLKPAHVVAFIILIIIFVTILKVFWPISA